MGHKLCAYDVYFEFSVIYIIFVQLPVTSGDTKCNRCFIQRQFSHSFSTNINSNNLI
jgi:hypothetical protein